LLVTSKADNNVSTIVFYIVLCSVLSDSTCYYDQNHRVKKFK